MKTNNNNSKKQNGGFGYNVGMFPSQLIQGYGRTNLNLLPQNFIVPFLAPVRFVIRNASSSIDALNKQIKKIRIKINEDSDIQNEGDSLINKFDALICVHLFSYFDVIYSKKFVLWIYDPNAHIPPNPPQQHQPPSEVMPGIAIELKPALVNFSNNYIISKNHTTQPTGNIYYNCNTRLNGSTNNNLSLDTLIPSKSSRQQSLTTVKKLMLYILKNYDDTLISNLLRRTDSSLLGECCLNAPFLVTNKFYAQIKNYDAYIKGVSLFYRHYAKASENIEDRLVELVGGYAVTDQHIKITPLGNIKFVNMISESTNIYCKKKNEQIKKFYKLLILLVLMDIDEDKKIEYFMRLFKYIHAVILDDGSYEKYCMCKNEYNKNKFQYDNDNDNNMSF